MFDLFGSDDRGFFGDAFDLNFDGKLDAFERAADMGLFMEMMKEEEREEDFCNYSDDEEY